MSATTSATESNGSIGAFLRAHPQFEFDLAEYLCSLQHLDTVKQKLAFFEFTCRRNWDFQNETKIVGAVRSIALTTPAYRGLSGVQRFHEIPFIDKSAVRADSFSFINRRFDEKELWCKTTSGTTGMPIRFFYSPEFYFTQLLLSISKIVIRADIGNTTSAPVFCLHLTDTQTSKCQVIKNPSAPVGLITQVVIDQTKPETLQELASLFEALKPAIITSRPELLEILVGTCAMQLHDYYPQAVVSSGSFLEEEQRRRFQDFFKTKVFNSYGLTEFGLVASECCNQDGLHIDETLVHAEIIGELDDPLPEGMEGELVLSSLANEGMPLIRYRTGDRGLLTSGKCVCKSTGKTLKIMSGRKVPCFRFESGILFSPTHFNNLFSLFQITEYQINQLNLKQIEVLIQPSNSALWTTSFSEEIRKYVLRNLPKGIDVIVKSTAFDDTRFHRYQTFAN